MTTDSVRYSYKNCLRALSIVKASLISERGVRLSRYVGGGGVVRSVLGRPEDWPLR